MSDPPRREERSYTLLLVQDRGRGRVRQLTLTSAMLRKVAVVGSVLGVLVALAGVVVAIELPRLWRFDDLVAENMRLKTRLHDIEGELEEVELTLRRLRVYDRQLRALQEDVGLPGGLGPLDDAESDALGLDALGALDGESPVEIDLHDLRPADVWAGAVEARAEGLLEVLREVEPRIGRAAEDVTDLLTIRAALPQVWPASGVLTSGFGYRRSPIYRSRKFHSGIDVSAPRGARVVSVAPGTVTMARYNGGYGRMVVVDHGFGIESRYAHNTSIFVDEGDYVEAGQVVATVGTTGQTTGPHLHFELMVDGQAVDPLDYLPK